MVSIKHLLFIAMSPPHLQFHMFTVKITFLYILYDGLTECIGVWLDGMKAVSTKDVALCKIAWVKSKRLLSNELCG